MADSAARRRELLEQLRRVLPRSDAFEEWLARTGELPPDFEAMPSSAAPPPFLRFADGRPVESAADWQARRAELLELVHRWLIGTMPPAPGNIVAETVSERVDEGGTTRELVLRFGPERRCSLRVSLLIPAGDGPFPVFLTQSNHRDWARIAVRRGYLGCVYAGADSMDDTPSFIDAYPEHDWSKLLRRAWAGSRCIDYLETQPFANTRQVCVTGHSRNGKQSLMAAATDPRIAVVISSSSGAGGCNTTREFGEGESGESAEMLTRVFPDWFCPRLRFFSGREDKLPVDFDALVALAAPRACLISTALNDSVESTFAVENTYLAAREVYRLLGAAEKLRILWRGGSHETWATIIEKYLDWCDVQFGRGSYAFEERLHHPHDWAAWRAAARPRVEPAPAVPFEKLLDGIDSPAAWAERRGQLREQVLRMLGEAPPESHNPDPDNYGAEPSHIAALMGRSSAPEGVVKRQVVFGEYLNGDLWMPAGFADDGARHPAVLWLSSYCCSTGYRPAYRRGEQPHLSLARAGLVTFCCDLLGTGRRIEEVEGFYQRHPRWSLLGKMVRDARAAIEILAGLPYVDPGRIAVLGFSAGAFVALHLAALDERIAALATVCPPAPFRLDSADRGTGSWRRWAERLLFVPRLGLHESAETLPYDVPLLQAAAAPRPQLALTPVLDRAARLLDQSRGLELARHVYALHGAAERLEQLAPETYHQFDGEQQQPVLAWLKGRLA